MGVTQQGLSLQKKLQNLLISKEIPLFFAGINPVRAARSIL